VTSYKDKLELVQKLRERTKKNKTGDINNKLLFATEIKGKHSGMWQQRRANHNFFQKLWDLVKDNLTTTTTNEIYNTILLA